MRKQWQLEEGWVTLFLIWVMILVSGIAVMQSDFIDGLYLVPIVGATAVVAGFFLAKSRFSTNKAHLFSLAYGLFAVFWAVGSLQPETMAWNARIFDWLERFVDWFRIAFDGSTNRDGGMFVLHTSIIFWLLGYTASWYTFRFPRVWRAIMPTGMVLLSVVYYYTGTRRLSLYLAAYAVLALLYVARTHLIFQEKSWRAASVRFDKSLQFTFLQSGFIAAILALVVAFALPSLTANAAVNDALGGARGPWRDFQDNWTRMFSALRSYGTATSDPYQDSLVLGGPRNVGGTLIMDVYVREPLPYSYWQAYVYDTYEDGLWRSSDTETDHYFPEDSFLDTLPVAARQVITQTVINYLPNSSTMYAAPEIVGANREMYVDYSPVVGVKDIASVQSRFVLKQGDRYQVASRVSTVDATSLRLAAQRYPDWITATYLQVPDSITPETKALAAQLTAAFDNPYDKAIAIRDYLRENIAYNDQITATPQDVDPVHFILFELQEGYCNYYASAMAMMLRSQGIPARIVSGYAQGDYDAETSSYRVRANNAHTWVEVYFPRYGWIQFEPTASIPVVERPETIADTGDAFANPVISDLDEENRLLQELNGAGLPGDPAAASSIPATGLGRLWQRLSSWQAVFALVVLLVASALLLVASRYNRQVEADITRSYDRLSSWGRWIGLRIRPVHTPHERARLLTTAVPEGEEAIHDLTQEYVLHRFSANKVGLNGFHTEQSWQTLRPLLLRKTIAQRWQRLKNGRFYR